MKFTESISGITHLSDSFFVALCLQLCSVAGSSWKLADRQTDKQRESTPVSQPLATLFMLPTDKLHQESDRKLGLNSPLKSHCTGRSRSVFGTAKSPSFPMQLAHGPTKFKSGQACPGSPHKCHVQDAKSNNYPKTSLDTSTCQGLGPGLNK